MKTIIVRIARVAAVLVLALACKATAQEFSFTVKHEHPVGSPCVGSLVLNQDGIEYRTNHKSHSRKWSFADIKMLKLESPTKVDVMTYETSLWSLGGDRTFEFKLTEGEINKAARDFLLSRIQRPMMSSFAASEEKARFDIPARHRHRLGGCQGRIRIYSDRVVYESDQPDGSRSWRWSDIRSISREGAYQFSIVSFEPQRGGPTKVYNFDLKEPMSDEAYDGMWAKVNRPARVAVADGRP